MRAVSAPIDSPFGGYDLAEDGPPMAHRQRAADELVAVTGSGGGRTYPKTYPVRYEPPTRWV